MRVALKDALDFEAFLLASCLQMIQARPCRVALLLAPLAVGLNLWVETPLANLYLPKYIFNYDS